MGCVPSMNDEKAPAPTVFPQTRLTTDYFWFLLFCFTTLVTIGCVIGCSLYADLDNIYTMDEFWEVDILILIDEGRHYIRPILMCLAWATGLATVIIAMMQYIADVLIVVSIAAVSIFLVVSMGLLWNMYVVEPDTEGLIGAVTMTLFLVFWFVFLLGIGNKMTLIYKLFEIAGVITFQNPWILICGFVNFLINLVIMGSGIFFFCVVSSAWYEIRNTDNWEQLVPLIVTSYILTIFTTVWWLLFLECSQKFVCGYSVGAWYFDDEELNDEGSTYNALLDLIDYHLGTVSFASLLYTIMFVPTEVMSLLRKLRSQKWIMATCDMLPECLTLWFSAVWEMLNGAPLYTCAIYSLPFCLSANRSMILTNFAIRLKVIMLGNVLCTMCIILVSLASTVITLFMIDPVYREHSVFLGFFLYLFSTVISSLLMVVFLNVTKSLYVCIYHDMRTNGIDLPLTVLQNINMYVMEVQMYAQNNLGLEVAPDQMVGGIPASVIAEMGQLPPGAENELNALGLMGDDDDDVYDA